jgi:carboxymethylenebutenolidase
MALIEKDVVVTTKYGRMPAFSACPDAPGQFPGIIVYMDAPGFRDELCNMARRIAKQGYFCLLPDLYYRYGGIRFDTPRRSEAMSAVIKAAWTNLNNADTTDDTAGMLAFLDAQEKVKPGLVGCVGFCMGGRFAMTVAARFPHRFGASASLYGVWLVTDKQDSPHLLANKIKGEIYYGFAEVDPSVPANVIPELRGSLEKAGTKHRIEVFPGTTHGFCFPERPDYHPIASEQAWSRLFDLWDRNLR